MSKYLDFENLTSLINKLMIKKQKIGFYIS